MNARIIGHYSHKNGQAKISISSELGGKTLYCKKVTYATYMRNLKRLIKEYGEEE